MRRTCVGSREDVDAPRPRPAGVGLQQRGEDADHGRLAGAVGPEQAQHGALGHAQVDDVYERAIGAGFG